MQWGSAPLQPPRLVPFVSLNAPPPIQKHEPGEWIPYFLIMRNADRINSVRRPVWVTLHKYICPALFSLNSSLSLKLNIVYCMTHKEGLYWVRHRTRFTDLRFMGFQRNSWLRFTYLNWKFPESRSVIVEIFGILSRKNRPWVFQDKVPKKH